MKFIITFALTSLVLASTFYGLILAVDPYNKFGNNLFGFETKAVDFARQNKFNQVEHSKVDYTAFLMGSSSAHRYMTKEINRLSGLVSYNYSTQSATPEDYISMTRHILTKFKPKLILLSMEFEGLNENTKTDDMFYSSPLKKFLKEIPADELKAPLFNDSYLTLEAIVDSVKVIWVNLFGEARHPYLDHGDHIVEPAPKSLGVKQFSYPDYIFSPRRIEYLKMIKDLGDKNGFKVIVFTSPLSYEHISRINQDAILKAKHAEFKSILVDIFGELYDFQNEGIKPFNTMQFFRDSNHPTHEFSTMVLEEIFGKNPPTIGRLLKK
jgi:hypothetical protein